MNPIRQSAFYLGAVLFLSCLVQGELLWIQELTKEQLLPEQHIQSEFEEYADTMEGLWKELVWFPVPASDVNPQASVAFENTWQAPRSYGGERVHEGTDIMAGIDEAGYYPVVSMTDGAVEQVGWLEKGGWRIGIRSDGGNYYYYAHLSSYAKEWEKGEHIRAGTLLGYMGDSGYGAQGTTGQFPVHLHLGVYVPLGADREMAVNPYWMLKYLENAKLSYSY